MKRLEAAQQLQLCNTSALSAGGLAPAAAEALALSRRPALAASATQGRQLHRAGRCSVEACWLSGGQSCSGERD